MMMRLITLVTLLCFASASCEGTYQAAGQANVKSKRIKGTVVQLKSESITFDVTNCVRGDYTITTRYARKKVKNGEIGLKVGTSMANFPATGGKKAFKTTTATVSLSDGANKIPIVGPQKKKVLVDHIVISKIVDPSAARTLVWSYYFQVTDEFLQKFVIGRGRENPFAITGLEDPVYAAQNYEDISVAQYAAQNYEDISVAHNEPIEEVLRKMDAFLENNFNVTNAGGPFLSTHLNGRLGAKVVLVYDSSGKYDISGQTTIHKSWFDPATGLYVLVWANADIGIDNNAIPGSGTFGTQIYQLGACAGGACPVGPAYIERIDGYPGVYTTNDFSNHPGELSNSTYITGTGVDTFSPEYSGDDRPKMPSSY